MGNINIWCIIIPLITAIIGYLLGRYVSIKSDTEEIDEELRNKNANLQAELNACLESKKKLNSDLDLCLASKSKANISSAPATASVTGMGIASTVAEDITVASSTVNEPLLAFDVAAAKLALGKKVVANDLKIVEGIGPKIAELFNNNGVKTWYQLSKTSIERCQEILNRGGKRYEIHKPASWPKQSGLAFEGKWKELRELQDYLDGGVEPK